MRSKSIAFIVVLAIAALVVLPQPAAAQGRRHHGGGTGVGIAIGLAIGGLVGFYADVWDTWDSQWYPPYGYPRYPYPPYRYRMMDNSAEVRIQVEPNSAEVYVDGYLAGNVDSFDGIFQRLYLAPGAHEIVVFKDGFRSLSRRMYFSPRASLKIHERLEPLSPGDAPSVRPMPAEDPENMRSAPLPDDAPMPSRDRDTVRDQRTARVEETEVGQVVVRVQPVEADIVIDGELWQRAQGADRLVVSLPVGQHRIDVRKPGLVPFTTLVTVRAGESIPLNVSLSER